jgi:excisionase family DNA binding protein
MKIPKTCQFCNQLFIAQTTVTKFCCTPCAQKAYKKRKREEKIQASLQSDLQALQSQQSLQSESVDDLSSKEFLSVKEAAQLLGASRWTIQRMITSQKIKHGKVGRRTIIPKSEIQNLFN